MRDTPGHWLASAVSVLGGDKKPFKLLSSQLNGANGAETLRILNRETGAVWVFTCFEERPPA